ncbi:MAG: thiamine pyrophosphate-binding protein [Chloroflexota bacterium]|nr:thiamine pyrophosphate-binding protein [Chloroflexota bacterium]MDE2942430.1 thiamine pyrophosphate-binding protein [Chloroflexota bacterium]MDE3267890.1 thiamine pyrophosphate-binding protein [Chloroflexota bacterium]
MAEISGGEAFGRALKQEGVEYVFTLNGGHIYTLYEGCEDNGIKVIDFRHEQAAAHAAEGWAKVTGKPGVAIVTAGPGVTGTITAVANAYQANSPMIVIGGNSAVRERLMSSLQEFDGVALMSSITKWSQQAQETKRIPDFVATAFRQATSGKPGPVYLEIPTDIVNGRIDEDDLVLPTGYRTEARVYPDPEYVRKIAEALKNSKHPAIVAGSDIWWSQAWDELREFVEMIDAPVFLNSMGRGSIPSDHPNLGSTGRRYALVNSDAILLIGTPVDFRLSFGRDVLFNKDATIMQMMMDAEEVGKNRHIDIGVVGDVKATLQMTMDELRAMGYRSPGREWLEEVMTEDRALKEPDQEMLNSTQTPIHPMRLMKELRDFLDYDATVVGDGGDTVTFAARVLGINRPGHWLDPGQFGCLGPGTGFAAAAQLARPGKQVCIVFGDGAFGLNGMDMETFVRFNLPVVGIVGNNGAWNQTTQGVIRRTGRAIGTWLSQETRYDQIMEGFGGYGERVEDPEQIRPALERAFGSGKAALLDVVLDQDVSYGNMGGRSRQVRQY